MSVNTTVLDMSVPRGPHERLLGSPGLEYKKVGRRNDRMRG